MADARTSGRSDVDRGIVLGLAVGLLSIIPTGVALKVAGYPSTRLYVGLSMAAVALLGLLVVAAVVARRRPRLAVGLIIGATATVALPPLLVLLDIGTHSA